MSCTEIMISNPVTLQAQANIGDALALLNEHHVHTLPVVDATGAFLGLFGTCELLGLLLPKAATWSGELDVGGIGFLPEGRPELHQRLEALHGETVADHLNTKAVCVHPDTPLMEALLLLRRSAAVLPVVEQGDNRLVGLITSNEALRRIAAEA